MRARVEEIDTELHNLIALAAKCGHSPAVVQAITGLEMEKKTITQQLLSTDQDSLTEQIRLIRQFAKTRFERLSDRNRHPKSEAGTSKPRRGHSHVAGTD